MDYIKACIFVLGFSFITVCVNGVVTNTDFINWLKNDPFNSYNKLIFARNASTDTVEVDITFYMVAITDFNELAGQLEFTGYLIVKWKTELLYWTASDSAMLNLMITQDNFWRPPIVLSNSVEALTELGDITYKIRIDRDGNQEWMVGLVAKSACSVDVSYYPFDTQQCDVSLTPWGYTDTQVTLNTTDSGIDMTHFMLNVEWTVKGSTVASKSSASASYLIYTITLERKPGYFLVNMIIPILILSLLNGLVFLLPADSGERVGYAITAFLTFAVFLTIVSDNLPKASEPMSLLCYFLTLMLVMSALTTVITIMALRVYHQDDDSPVPGWIKHSVAFLTCRKCKRKWCKKPEEKAEDDSEDKTEYDDDGESSDDGSDKEDEVMENPDVDTEDINWRIVGYTLDMFFFILFMVGTVVITGFFLIPLAVSAGTDTSNEEEA